MPQEVCWCIDSNEWGYFSLHIMSKTVLINVDAILNCVMFSEFGSLLRDLINLTRQT